METEYFLELLSIILLVSALIILVGTLVKKKQNDNMFSTFNSIFILFLISWITIEILHLFLLESIEILISGLHFGILAFIAIWMNVHFYRVMKKMREIT